jgi:hypothetical protein
LGSDSCSPAGRFGGLQASQGQTGHNLLWKGSTIRELSRESGIGSSENADLRDSILRQLKEMLNGLQGKGFPQLNYPDLSSQRPSRHLHKFQGSSRQFVPG